MCIVRYKIKVAYHYYDTQLHMQTKHMEKKYPYDCFVVSSIQ